MLSIEELVHPNNEKTPDNSTEFDHANTDNQKKLIYRQLVTPSESSLASKITFVHKWTVESFGSLCAKNHPWKSNWSVWSSYFTPPKNPSFRFALWLFPKGFYSSEPVGQIGHEEEAEPFVALALHVNELPFIYDCKIRFGLRVLFESENENHLTEILSKSYNLHLAEKWLKMLFC